MLLSCLHAEVCCAVWLVCAGVALSGILAVLTACQDLKATLGSKHHYLLYCLATGEICGVLGLSVITG
jgi:hypothetical protein